MTVPIAPTPWFHRAHLCNPSLFGSILLVASEVECPACLMLLTCWDCVYFIHFPWLPCFCWGWVGYVVKSFCCLSVLSVFIVNILDRWCCTSKTDQMHHAILLSDFRQFDIFSTLAERRDASETLMKHAMAQASGNTCIVKNDHDTVAGADCGCSGQCSQKQHGRAQWNLG